LPAKPNVCVWHYLLLFLTMQVSIASGGSAAAAKQQNYRHRAGMPRKRRAQPATKAQRRRGLGVLIDGLTSELEDRQQLLTELQEEHSKLRSSHDILVGYCDALEFGIELERARQDRWKASCKGNSTAAAAAAAAGLEDGVPWQHHQGSLAGNCGVNEAEQQLLAQLAQLHYSTQPLGAPTAATAGQQQPQQQQGEEGEMVSRNLSGQSNSSSTTTYPSSQTAVESRICPVDDKFLLFRWLMAQVGAVGSSCISGLSSSDSPCCGAQAGQLLLQLSKAYAVLHAEQQRSCLRKHCSAYIQVLHATLPLAALSLLRFAVLCCPLAACVS
jgi:hypothetical protein